MHCRYDDPAALHHAGLAQHGQSSHPEFPLERLCRHRCAPFQLTFALIAQRVLQGRDEVLAVASEAGLAIRGETEDAIDAAMALLAELFGASVRVGSPRVRFHHGVTLEQPWMDLRVRCMPADVAAVSADLIDRDAAIIACGVEAARLLLHARAPLARLLGYRQALQQVTTGGAQHVMSLSHYAPLPQTPGHARAFREMAG